MVIKLNKASKVIKLHTATSDMTASETQRQTDPKIKNKFKETSDFFARLISFQDQSSMLLKANNLGEFMNQFIQARSKITLFVSEEILCIFS